MSWSPRVGQAVRFSPEGRRSFPRAVGHGVITRVHTEHRNCIDVKQDGFAHAMRWNVCYWEPVVINPPAQPVDTSRAAAAKIKPQAESIRERIYRVLATQGVRGATAGELEVALEIPGSTLRPRLRELEGTAPWAKGRLPARIQRIDGKRNGMRIYIVLPKPFWASWNARGTADGKPVDK